MKRPRFMFSNSRECPFRQFAFGCFRLHVIKEPDEPVFHDHPCWYWTVPLNRLGYVEMLPCGREVVVRGWVPNFRRASHTHRIMRPTDGRWPIITALMFGPFDLSWNFEPKGATHGEGESC